MDQASFDRLARLLGGATTRRTGLRAALGGALGTALGGGALDAAAKARHKPGKEGPCGDGSRKDNICTKDKDCCTGVCNMATGKKNKDGKGRCRCVRKGGACTADKNCCKGMTCSGNVCGGSTPPPPSPCDTPTVCASGCPFTTIQTAINAATEGDTIFIGAGSYVESLTIGKNLVLEGCSATVTDTGGFRTVTVTAGTVELRNLTIDGTGDLIARTNGGGIDVQAGSLTLSGTTKVTRGYMSSYGGGVSVITGQLTMQDSASVDGCGASVGAGVTLYDGTAVLEMKDTSRIVNCVSGGKGAGVYSGSGGTVTMSGSSEISGNSTTIPNNGIGGGVSLFGSALTMSGSAAIKNNTSAYNGGGVAAEYGLSGSSVTLTESATITGNTSTGTNSGSGLWSDDSRNTATGCAGITGNTPDPQVYGLTCS